jgi:hypothetical protein
MSKPLQVLNSADLCLSLLCSLFLYGTIVKQLFVLGCATQNHYQQAVTHAHSTMTTNPSIIFQKTPQNNSGTTGQ